MRGFACVTRNASAAHLQGLPAGAVLSRHAGDHAIRANHSLPLGQAKTVPLFVPHPALS
jgi:hypothetical protein